MKTQAVSLLVVLLLAVSGCPAGGRITTGRYIVDDEPSAYLILHDDGTFILSGPPYISYSPGGSYRVLDGKVVLTAADDEEYSFSVRDGELIFEGGQWLENWVEVSTAFYIDPQQDS